MGPIADAQDSFPLFSKMLLGKVFKFFESRKDKTKRGMTNTNHNSFHAIVSFFVARVEKPIEWAEKPATKPIK